MSAITKFAKSLKKFHNDERGLEALQVVMIIAVASVALLLVKSRWQEITDWFNDLVGQILGWKK